VVDNGHVTLYGTVENAADKKHPRNPGRSLVPGAFSVDNKLVVN